MQGPWSKINELLRYLWATLWNQNLSVKAFSLSFGDILFAKVNVPTEPMIVKISKIKTVATATTTFKIVDAILTENSKLIRMVN